MNIIKHLEVFKFVAETESFTKAADLAKLPRSTVSSAIKALEKKLDTRLFYRTTRQVHLTQEGSLLLERSRHLLFEVDEVTNLFREPNNLVKGKLKIDVPSRIAAKMISPALPDFFEKYPDIELEMGATDRKVDLVEEGIDCVIRVGELSSSNLIAKKLGHFKFIICASPKYIDQYGLPANHNEMQDHWAVNYLSTPNNKKEVWNLYRNDKNYRIKMHSRISVNHAESYIECAIAGLGLIQIPEFDVRDHINQGRLVRVLSQYEINSLPVYALYPHREYVPKTVRSFIEWTESLLENSLSKT